MSSEFNAVLVRRILGEIWNAGNLDLVDQLFSPNYVGYIGTTTELHGREQDKENLRVFRTAFPDLNLTIEDLVADGDKVIVRWTGRGTHTGEFRGLPPSGNQINVVGISIFLVVNNMVEREWQAFDSLTLMQQLGVIPAPSAS